MPQITIDVDDMVADNLNRVAKILECSVPEYAASLVSERLMRNPNVKKRPRKELCGILKGKVWMSDDFNAPLELVESKR